MYHWDAGWGWWMSIAMAMFWIAVVVGIWFIARSSGTRDRHAEDILAERYARGELSTDEFETQRRILRLATKSHE